MFDGGNHRTHLCTKLIEKCKKEGKPMPVDPTTLPHKVETTPKPSTSLEPALTISSLNNCQIIEVVGEIQGIAIKMLIDGAAQVNASVPRIMKLFPSKKQILK